MMLTGKKSWEVTPDARSYTTGLQPQAIATANSVYSTDASTSQYSASTSGQRSCDRQRFYGNDSRSWCESSMSIFYLQTALKCLLVEEHFSFAVVILDEA